MAASDGFLYLPLFVIPAGNLLLPLSVPFACRSQRMRPKYSSLVLFNPQETMAAL
jgi:hypothetical protein